MARKTPTKSAVSSAPVAPLRPGEFGLTEHVMRHFCATVASLHVADDLEDPRFWGLVAAQLAPGTEVRVVAEDFSFRAVMLCTYKNGSDVRMKTVEYKQLEAVSYDSVEDTQPYFVKNCGPKKWCIIKRETGEKVIENIASQSLAHRELEDYLKMLAA